MNITAEQTDGRTEGLKLISNLLEASFRGRQKIGNMGTYKDHLYIREANSREARVIDLNYKLL